MTKLTAALTNLNNSIQRIEIINLMKHVVAGGDITVTYVYRDYDNEGNLKQARFTPDSHGTYYSMVSLTEVTDDWFIGDLTTTEEERLDEIQQGWVMFPALMEVLDAFCDAEGVRYELSAPGKLNFNMSAIRTILTCHETGQVPSNPRQAAALGLASELFI